MRVVEQDANGATLSNELYYYHTDHLGSTAVLTRHDNGHILGSSFARYLPYGRYRTTPTDTVTDRGYTGHRHNDDLGLVYMNARFYVSSIGRFASADTIVPDPTNPQSFNRYSYVRNNPINFTDPTGHRECGGPYDPSCDGEPFPENRSKDSSKGQNPIRINIIDSGLLGDEIGIKGLELIFLPPSTQPQPVDKNQAAFWGWLGAGVDFGEGLLAAAHIPAAPTLLALADVGISGAGSYFSGESGPYMQLHEDLPEMFIIGQDVVVTGTELAIPPAAMVTLGLAGTVACGPQCGLAGVEAGNLVDIGTSVASFVYDTSRILDITPTYFAVGFYLDTSVNTKVPVLDNPGQPTMAIIIYQNE